jgi:hypothetical protein
MKVEGIGKPDGCKLIRISAEIENGVISSIRIRGDFFASPEELFDRIEKALEGTLLREIPGVFDSFVREKGIETYGIDGPGLAEVLGAAVAAAPREARHGL